jgi:hypothetical protein
MEVSSVVNIIFFYFLKFINVLSSFYFYRYMTFFLVDSRHLSILEWWEEDRVRAYRALARIQREKSSIPFMVLKTGFSSSKQEDRTESKILLTEKETF